MLMWSPNSSHPTDRNHLTRLAQAEASAGGTRTNVLPSRKGGCPVGMGRQSGTACLEPLPSSLDEGSGFRDSEPHLASGKLRWEGHTTLHMAARDAASISLTVTSSPESCHAAGAYKRSRGGANRYSTARRIEPVLGPVSPATSRTQAPAATFQHMK